MGLGERAVRDRNAVATVATSAPAKVILFGEHGVNRQQPALAAAVEPRVHCEAVARTDDGYAFRSGDRIETGGRDGLLRFKAEVDGLREAGDLDTLHEKTGRDFFAPARYVLATVVDRFGGPGLDVEWRSGVPVGSGLGSGAAAAASLALAAMRAAGRSPEPKEVASLAWQGDVVAHGGVASGLDSGASALGGLIEYTSRDGPWMLSRVSLPLVVGDTLVAAKTGEVNARVRRNLEEHPARCRLFAEMGLLVRHARGAIRDADLATTGHLMNLNQLLLEKLGVSSPAIENLVEAALGAGALGAKLSGSGGGGIIVALTPAGGQPDVARAIEEAGGRAMVAATGIPGVRVERMG